MFILKRPANTSLFHWGFAIPNDYTPTIQNNLSEGPVLPGTSRKINLMIGGESFPVKITNINARARGNREILQIRYDNDQNILSHFHFVFQASWNYLSAQRNSSEYSRKKHITLPDDLMEYIELQPLSADTFGVELFPCVASQKLMLTQQITEQGEDLFSDKEFLELKNILKNVPEILTEIFDNDTDYYLGIALQRIRKLNRNIGDNLKKLYNFRCQITGEKIGGHHGADVVEVHHIIPFTQSLNNNSSNLIVVSPNFHRIIHQVHPIFDREKLQFVFENGVIEKVNINNHLRCSVIA